MKIVAEGPPHMNDERDLDEPTCIMPAGAERHLVHFESTVPASGEILCALDDLAGRRAVIVESGARKHFVPQPTSLSQLELWTIPSDAQHAEAWIERLRPRLDRDAHARGRASLLITLQNAYVLWSPSVVVLLASQARLHDLRAALVQAAFGELDMQALEAEVRAGWDPLQRDSALAFAYDEEAMSRRDELRGRFQSVLNLRMRFACLVPLILVPHLHPPTLASQIGERMRERGRLAERLEFLREKLEVQERAYEMLGQRASDFVLARTGHILEWVIIVLLAGQTILLIVELLGSTSGV